MKPVSELCSQLDDFFLGKRSSIAGSITCKFSFPHCDVYDVPLDGGCAPAALAHLLSISNIRSLSENAAREECVNMIISDPELKATVAERLTGRTIEDYLKDMAKPSTLAEENLLYAASLVYHVQIYVIHVDTRAQNFFLYPRRRVAQAEGRAAWRLRTKF